MSSCVILILVLRQIGRVLSKTLVIDSWLVVRNGPRSLVYITEGSGAILQREGSASTADEEATVREPRHRILPHELLGAIFGARLPTR